MTTRSTHRNTGTHGNTGRTIHRRLLAGLLTATFLGAGIAGAADDVVTKSMSVSYGDLNLDTREGNATLYRRLRAAALRVCGEPDSRDLRSTTEARACFAKAMDTAVRQIDRAPLTALHARRSARDSG